MSNINIQNMYSGLELVEESEYRIKKSVWYCYVVNTFENSPNKRKKSNNLTYFPLFLNFKLHTATQNLDTYVEFTIVHNPCNTDK
jgi:hypothetical protein